MIFFTADTHFSSNRTLEFSKRPFENVRQMDAWLIDAWNYRVEENDTVYHLGDFGNYEIKDQLNGTIILLPGNYEDNDGIEIYSKHFQNIIEPNSIIDYHGTRLRLIHEPDESNMNNDFVLFGHIHKLQMVKKNGLNVGCDNHNFCPISIDDVLFWKNAIENHYDHNVFQSGV